MAEFHYENEKSAAPRTNTFSGANADYAINDNRTSAVAQRKFQELTSTPGITQRSELPIEENEDNPIQGKFATVQRIGDEDDEMPIQKQSVTAQKQDGLEEEEPLQGKFENRSPTAQLQENTPQPNMTGMPNSLKSGIEQISGLSMDDVRVHYNSDKPAQLQALAYTQNTDIHVAPGQEKHLPHEAWHVVQQMQGRVEPTLQMEGGVAVNDDAGLEKEADLMGERAR